MKGYLYMHNRLKSVSLINFYSFYWLFNSQKYNILIIKLFESIIKSKDNYKIMKTYNTNSLNLRSYFILEGEEIIVFIDFNRKNNKLKLHLDQEIVEFLKLLSKKLVYLIILNNFEGQDSENNMIYNFYCNSSNELIRFFYGFSNQKILNVSYSELQSFLLSLGNNFYRDYLNEEKKEENIYKFYDM